MELLTDRGFTQCTLHTTTSTIPLALIIKSSTHTFEADALSPFVKGDEDEKYKIQNNN
jgi:hypothetical protein